MDQRNHMQLNPRPLLPWISQPLQESLLNRLSFQTLPPVSQLPQEDWSVGSEPKGLLSLLAQVTQDPPPQTPMPNPLGWTLLERIKLVMMTNTKSPRNSSVLLSTSIETTRSLSRKRSLPLLDLSKVACFSLSPKRTKLLDSTSKKLSLSARTTYLTLSLNYIRNDQLKFKNLNLITCRSPITPSMDCREWNQMNPRITWPRNQSSPQLILGGLNLTMIHPTDLSLSVVRRPSNDWKSMAKISPSASSSSHLSGVPPQESPLPNGSKSSEDEHLTLTTSSPLSTALWLMKR